MLLIYETISEFVVFLLVFASNERFILCLNPLCVYDIRISLIENKFRQQIGLEPDKGGYVHDFSL